MKRGDPLLVECLKECTEWLYNKTHDDNPGEDKKGDLHMKHNKGRDIWLLTGYFNTLTKPPKLDGSPKIVRAIKIPPGKKIFVMVASAHATKFDVPNIPESSITDRDLSVLANMMQRLWTRCILKMDKETIPTVEVETDMNTVTIPGKGANDRDHPYVSYYPHLGVKPGPTPIVSVSQVAMIEYDGEPHKLDFECMADGHAMLGEIPYEESIRFEISPESVSK